MWNGNNGQYMNIFQGHSAPVTGGKFTPEGHYIVSISEDKSLRVWNPKSGENIHKIAGKIKIIIYNKFKNNLGYGFHDDVITSLDFHSKLPVVLTGSLDRTACLSNYSSGKVIFYIKL